MLASIALILRVSFKHLQKLHLIFKCYFQCLRSSSKLGFTLFAFQMFFKMLFCGFLMTLITDFWMKRESDLICVYQITFSGYPNILTLILSFNGMLIKSESSLVGMYFLYLWVLQLPRFLTSQYSNFMKILQNVQPKVENMPVIVTMYS